MAPPLMRSEIERIVRDADGIVATAAHWLGVSPRTLARRIAEVGGIDFWSGDFVESLREFERQTVVDALTFNEGGAMRRYMTEVNKEPSWLEASNFQKRDCAASDE